MAKHRTNKLATNRHKTTKETTNATTVTKATKNAETGSKVDPLEQDDPSKRCYICFCPPVHPVYLCSEDHFTCFFCILPLYRIPRCEIKWNKGKKPTIELNYDTNHNLTCGICKQKCGSLGYVGAAIRSVLNPNEKSQGIETKCNYCHMDYSTQCCWPNTLAEKRHYHLIHCSKLPIAFMCPLKCANTNFMQEKELKIHLETTCDKHQCAENCCALNEMTMTFSELIEHRKEQRVVNKLTYNINDVLQEAQYVHLDVLKEIYSKLRKEIRYEVD